MPKWLVIIWGFALTFSLSLIGFVVWVIYTQAGHVTGG